MSLERFKEWSAGVLLLAAIVVIGWIIIGGIR